MIKARPQAGSSIIRRFTLWFFEHPPFDPYVTANVVIDFSGALAYLESLPKTGPRVTINDLMIGVVGRLYAEFPEANGRVINRRIQYFDSVSIAAPVDLLGSDAVNMELSIALIEGADRLSLLEIARRTKRTIEGEREGRPQHPVLKLLFPIAERTPDWVFHKVLDGIDRVSRSALAGPLMQRLLPVSCVVSNPGAVFRNFKGGRFLGASMSPPARLCPVGSVLGLSAIQDEVMVVDGQPVVRPGLPVVFVFDHRLFDGVMCSRILRRMAEMLQEPEVLFGAEGQLGV